MQDLLFLCHRIPYPPNKGDKIRCWNIFRHLSERFHVHLACFVDDRADHCHEMTVRDRCGESLFLPLAPARATIRSTRKLLTGEPLTLGYYGNSTLANWVKDIVIRRGIDRAFIFSSSMAHYVAGDRFGQLFRVVDLVDVDSEKWRQYAARRRWPAREIYAREGRRLLEFERRVARESAAVILVSRQEAALFARLAPDCLNRIHAIPNGVDFEYFSPLRTYDNPFPAGVTPLVFVGAMDYWPNIDAVQWFATEILPLVTANGLSVQFYIVGASPSPLVRRLGRISSVTVTGRVADVRPFVAHASVLVAPMRIARGIQNKVLEAMAMAKVVVTTSVGLEGIEAEPGRQVRVANDPPTFAAAVRQAIGGRENRTLGAQARGIVIARHSWDDSLRRIEEIVSGCAAEA
jgi:sugar transferase (PEP-CTERM/EpsH1 system associated)